MESIMKKSLLLVAGIACMALASAAFAIAPPSTASPGYQANAEASYKTQTAAASAKEMPRAVFTVTAAAKDVSPIALKTLATGPGQGEGFGLGIALGHQPSTASWRQAASPGTDPLPAINPGGGSGSMRI
jgi:hypothetical protein